VSFWIFSDFLVNFSKKFGIFKKKIRRFNPIHPNTINFYRKKVHRLIMAVFRWETISIWLPQIWAAIFAEMGRKYF
jgi:hypothetical protein